LKFIDRNIDIKAEHFIPEELKNKRKGGKVGTG
jgi:hypothetical protein